jgi:hypothetical protein
MPAVAADVGPQLTLDAAQVRAGDIETSPLATAQQAPTVAAFGPVIDPGKLAVASAKLAGARAAVTQAKARLTLARAEGTRAAALFHAEGNISEAQYQTAQVNVQVAAADLDVVDAQLHSEAAQLRADWGAPLATAVTDDKAPVPELVSGTACLVRLTLPFGSALASAPERAAAATPAGSAVALRLIGPSPRSPAGAGSSYFYLGGGVGCPPVGMTVEAELATGAKRDGVVVPASAVVWRGGKPIAYRQDGENAFTPVPLDTAAAVTGGYFMPTAANSSLQAGQTVVVKGAGLLVSQSEMPAVPKTAGGGGGDDD